MQTSLPFLPEDLYPRQLSLIREIPFTRREIDVMACLLNGKIASKRIAYLLPIDPRTIDTFIRNITLKIKGNTREEIIDFLETSDKIPLLKKHYAYLQIEVAFAKSLKDICKRLQENRPFCILENKEEEGSFHFFLVTLLQDHLKLAGFQVTHDTTKHKDNYVICILPSDLQTLSPSFAHHLKQYPKDKTLLLLSIGQEKQILPKELKGFKTLSSEKYNNYYFYMLDIIKIFFPNSKIDAIILSFQDKYKRIYDPRSDHPPQPFMQVNKEKLPFFKHIKFMMLSRKWLVSSALLIVFFMIIGFFNLYRTSGHNSQQHFIALSELPLPTKSVFLERPELFQEIDKGFRKRDSIQTIALLGIGGSGKTTLARQYAHEQKANIVWEINAENNGNLYGSFENFAHALGKTEEEKRTLQALQELKNSSERKEKLIIFVKERLKLYSPWFLIFDNVANFSDIQQYFPQDSKTWGEGKIILTTRNNNIQNSPLISHVISTGELTPEQKLGLFTKIMNDETLHSKKSEEISAFLEQLPPFPLDISVAAYYLKSTNIPYVQYIEKLNSYTKETNELQENILKETGVYTRTRYAIIAHSLDHLIKNHKDFSDLFLFISLLDSQNIPKSLLDQYKNSDIVDNFIYQLKKHSLITAQTSPSSLEPKYSMHRSTQSISLAYLIESLKVTHESPQLREITFTLDDYADKTIEQEDFARMEMIAPHLEKTLRAGLLTGFSQGLLESKLGSIYYFVNNDKEKHVLDSGLKILIKQAIEHLSSKDTSRMARAFLDIGTVYTELRLYKEAEALFQKAIHIYETEDSRDDLQLSWALSHLGNIYRRVGDYDKAKRILEKSIHLHKEYKGDKQRAARSLGYLGSVYRGLGFYQKAIHALEESLDIYNKNYSRDHFRIGWTLTRLGNVYSDLGDFQKAKEHFEKGLMISKKYFPEDHMNLALTLTYLGNCYRDLNEYEKSRDVLEQSLRIHKKHFEQKYRRMGWVLYHLATTYKALGKHKDAQKFYDQVLEIYANYCHEDDIETAGILRNMARICLDKNRLDEAETLIKKSLKTLQSRQHVDAYRSLEVLGEIYLKKAGNLSDNKKNQENEHWKNQAQDLFSQALEIAEQNFPENSLHIERIKLRKKRMYE
ncbi:MAG: tetratricopeptide repeat protein [Alphaproteobacteria bacterium]|nr:tetratricopeptide repeat protein [Alphaproteobacteria bacterium]